MPQVSQRIELDRAGRRIDLKVQVGMMRASQVMQACGAIREIVAEHGEPCDGVSALICSRLRLAVGHTRFAAPLP